MLNGPRYADGSNPDVQRCAESGQNRLIFTYAVVAAEDDISDAYRIMEAISTCAPYFHRFALPADNRKVRGAMALLVTRAGMKSSPLLVRTRDSPGALRIGKLFIPVDAAGAIAIQDFKLLID